MSLDQEYVLLQEEHHRLKDKYRGQEQALEELAGQLKKEILKSSELEEAATSALAQAHWERDNEVANCKKCEKEFSLRRRKVRKYMPILLVNTKSVVFNFFRSNASS